MKFEKNRIIVDDDNIYRVDFNVFNQLFDLKADQMKVIVGWINDIRAHNITNPSYVLDILACICLAYELDFEAADIMPGCEMIGLNDPRTNEYYRNMRNHCPLWSDNEVMHGVLDDLIDEIAVTGFAFTEYQQKWFRAIVRHLRHHCWYA